MQTLFDILATRYSSAAQCAAALGITRQAFQQARTRGRLSDRAAIRAAALTDTDPGRALLINATGNDPAAPIDRPAPHPAQQIQGEKKPAQTMPDTPTNNARTTNYAQLSGIKKSGNLPAMRKNVHVILQSEKRLYELDCVRWMLCVPRISPDSPRFVQYFSRWLVPEKIATAKSSGKFDDYTKNCPSFSPELCKFIPAGLAEYRRFTKQDRNEAPSSPPGAAAVNTLTAAA